RAETRHLALDGGPVAHQNDGGAELPDRRHRALDDDCGAVVAPHGVYGDLQARPLRRRRLTVRVTSAGSRSEPDEARGRSRAEGTRLYGSIGDDRERSMAMAIGPAPGPCGGPALAPLVV